MKANLLFLLIAVLASCKSGAKYEYWDVSKFQVTEDALKDGEKVKILYSSQAPYEPKEPCYIHLVVVSQESGDTVNVLTGMYNMFKKEDADSVFTFHDKNSAYAKLMSKFNEIVPDSLKDQAGDLKNYEMKDLTKVARDPKFDHIADNHFPAIIGMVMKGTTWIR